MKNVMDFGAKGDQINDDTDAIQAAINAVKVRHGSGTGIVYFPPGNYRITRTLMYFGSWSDGIWFVGEVGTARGPAGSVIEWDGPTLPVVVTAAVGQVSRQNEVYTVKIPEHGFNSGQLITLETQEVDANNNVLFRAGNKQITAVTKDTFQYLDFHAADQGTEIQNQSPFTFKLYPMMVSLLGINGSVWRGISVAGRKRCKYLIHVGWDDVQQVGASGVVFEDMTASEHVGVGSAAFLIGNDEPKKTRQTDNITWRNVLINGLAVKVTASNDLVSDYGIKMQASGNVKDFALYGGGCIGCNIGRAHEISS